MTTLGKTTVMMKVKKTSKKTKPTMKLYLEEMKNGMSPVLKQISEHKFIITSTEYDIANAVIDLLCKDANKNKLYHTCGEKSGGRQMWYKFQNHRWNEIESIVFRELISNEFCNLVEEYSEYIKGFLINIPQQLKDDKTNEDDIEQLTKQSNKLFDICLTLKKTSWKNNITSEAFDILYKDKFTDKLDVDANLLCCKNGVVDLANKCFREGRPEDMCSLSTNINYFNEIQNVDDERELDKFINTIFTFESQREYMLDHFASTLYGTTQNQTFTYYIGVGSNGKSQIVDLMGHTLGDYKKVVPLQLVTQKRTSIGGTSSEVAQLRGVRYAVLSEPQKGDKLNEGIMKELTGGDKIQARMLFKNSIEFRPMFSLAVCANTYFQIGSDDDGTWRRIKVCEFHSKFVDKKEDDDDLQFEKDKFIPDKLQKWKEIFLHKLVQRAFITEGNVNDCEMVLSATKKYRLSQNRVKQYIDENVIEDKSSKVLKIELYRDIKEWFENNFKYSIKNRDVCEILDKTYDSTSTHYIGFRLKNEYEDNTLITKEEIFLKAFNEKYLVTKDRKDYVKSVSISEWAKLNDFKVNSSKEINAILKSEFGLDSKNSKDWGDKKINGKAVKVWFGIQEKTTETVEVEQPVEDVEKEYKEDKVEEVVKRRPTMKIKKSKKVHLRFTEEKKTEDLTSDTTSENKLEEEKPDGPVGLAENDMDYILANI